MHSFSPEKNAKLCKDKIMESLERINILKRVEWIGRSIWKK